MNLKKHIIPMLFLVGIAVISIFYSVSQLNSRFSNEGQSSESADVKSPPLSERRVVAGGTAKVVVQEPVTGKPIEITIKDERPRQDVENGSGNTSSAQKTVFTTIFDTLSGILWTLTKWTLGIIAIYLMVALIKGRGRLGAFNQTSHPGGQAGASGPEAANKVFGQWIDPKDIKGNGFADVAGVPEAIGQMQKVQRKIREQAQVVEQILLEEEKKTGNKKATAPGIIDRLQSTTKKSKFGGKVPQCVLLEGPPGTGKTLLVTALAKECNVPVFVIAGSDFVEMFVGLGASRVRDMFAAARAKRPCIVFIDELDAVGRARSNSATSNPEADQTLNQILVELQGLNTGNQNFALWIFGATNRVDILDPALLRPGRFTWKIKVDPPNIVGRKAILKVHCDKREVPLDDSVNFHAVASVLGGLTGADLENVVNETALYADELAEAEAAKLRARGGVSEDDIKARVKSSISQEDFFEGLLRHLMGVKRDVALTFDEIFNTVVHEVGHALGNAYEEAHGRTNDKVRFIAVEPRGRTGGLTFKTPARDAFTHTLQHVDADAVCGFGGSAAQLVFLDTKDSGTDNDFEVVSVIIYRAIARWYASDKLGPISLGQRGMTNSTEMGAAQKDLIDSECNLKTKVLYARSWWIMNLFIRSESIWTMFWELLERKIMREDRFAELFAQAMKEVEAHPEWNKVNLDELTETVKQGPYTWAPQPLDSETRAYLTARIEELHKRYAALGEDNNQPI